jgi:hypothetical protein
VPFHVYAMIAFDDGSGPGLVAGGGFSVAGGTSANNIAKWDGSSWAPLGGGLDHAPSKLAIFDDGTSNASCAGTARPGRNSAATFRA